MNTNKIRLTLVNLEPFCQSISIDHDKNIDDLT